MHYNENKILNFKILKMLTIFIIIVIVFILLWVVINYIIFFVTSEFCSDNNLSIFNIKNLVTDNNNKLSNLKIAIITIENRESEYLKIHNKSISKYCKKFGYDYIFKTTYDSDLPVYWHKLLIVKDHLKDYDYILWLDSDTIICNYDIQLELLIKNNKDIYIGYDYPILLQKVYCAGVFMLKNSDTSINFLNDCLNDYLGNNFCKENGKPVLKGKWAGQCYEQGIMNKMIKNKYEKETLIISDKIFRNCIFPLKVTDYFILHLYCKDKPQVSKHFTGIEKIIEIN